MAFSAPRGRLEESVKLKHKGFLKYDIMMLNYGKAVDEGTKPHKVSKPYLFKPWQRKTGTKSLSTAIFKRGTKAHPFIKTTKEHDVLSTINDYYYTKS